MTEEKKLFEHCPDCNSTNAKLGPPRKPFDRLPPSFGKVITFLCEDCGCEWIVVWPPEHS